MGGDVSFTLPNADGDHGDHANTTESVPSSVLAKCDTNPVIRAMEAHRKEIKSRSLRPSQQAEGSIIHGGGAAGSRRRDSFGRSKYSSHGGKRRFKSAREFFERRVASSQITILPSLQRLNGSDECSSEEQQNMIIHDDINRSCDDVEILPGVSLAIVATPDIHRERREQVSDGGSEHGSVNSESDNPESTTSLLTMQSRNASRPPSLMEILDTNWWHDLAGTEQK